MKSSTLGTGGSSGEIQLARVVVVVGKFVELDEGMEDEVVVFWDVIVILGCIVEESPSYRVSGGCDTWAAKTCVTAR